MINMIHRETGELFFSKKEKLSDENICLKVN